MAEESLAEAVSILEGLARENPEHHKSGLAVALYALGEHVAAAGRWEAADPPLRRAVELLRDLSRVDTKWSDDVIHRISGWSSSSGGDLRNALAVLGVVQLKLGRWDEAERLWLELLQLLDPSPSGPAGEAEYAAQVLMNLATLYMDWGRQADANRALDDLAHIARRNPRILEWVKVLEADH